MELLASFLGKVHVAVPHTLCVVLQFSHKPFPSCRSWNEFLHLALHAHFVLFLKRLWLDASLMFVGCSGVGS